jgi:hypothetical protein
VSKLTFAYAYLFVLVCLLGTGTGMQMYYLVSAGLTLLFFGYERVVLSATLIVVALIAAAFRYPNPESLLVPTPLVASPKLQLLQVPAETYSPLKRPRTALHRTNTTTAADGEIYQAVGWMSLPTNESRRMAPSINAQAEEPVFPSAAEDLLCQSDNPADEIILVEWNAIGPSSAHLRASSSTTCAMAGCRPP